MKLINISTVFLLILLMTIKYVTNQHPEDPFDLCYQIRFNPFDYVSTDIVMRIDGSMEIVGDTDLIINYFLQNNYDACIMIHPGRNNILDEYQTWCDHRAYSPQQANKILGFIAQTFNYDAKNYKGLYQYNFMIQKNDKFNNLWNNLTLDILKLLAEDNKQIERIDQTIGSVILNKFFNNKNIMTVSQAICGGSFFNWYIHGTNDKLKITFDKKYYIQPYLFNQPVITIF